MRLGVAGVLAVAALAGGVCGTVLAGSGALGTPARTGPASATPPAGSRGEAEAYARQLLARVVLPPGTRPVRLAAVPEPVRDPFGWTGPGDSSAGTGRVYLAPQPMNAAASFLLAHPPRGIPPLGGRPSAGKATGTQGMILGEEVDWVAPRLPSGIQSALLRILVAPRSSGSALIGVYDNVYWFPARSAAEHIDARRYQRVTVSATVDGTSVRTVSRTFTSAALIGRLAGYLNGLPASPGAVMGCPWSLVTYRLTFTGAGVPDVVVFAGGCLSDGVTAGGRAQPELQDESSGLAAMAEQVMHVSPPRL